MEPAGDSNNNKGILTRILERVNPVTHTNVRYWVKFNKSDILLAVSVVLMVVVSFNLGKLAANNGSQTPITVSQQNAAKQANLSVQMGGNVVAPVKDYTNIPVYASKNSKGKLYHFGWCPGMSMIADKNKLTFSNENAAKAAGYSLASNCKR